MVGIVVKYTIIWKIWNYEGCTVSGESQCARV